jgi:molybdopterin synthase sulfur carrier subunit
MKYYVNDQTEVQVTGRTIDQALNDLTSRFPTIKTHIMDSQGKLRRHVNVFVNAENIRTLNGLDTVVGEKDKIILMSSISGG